MITQCWMKELTVCGGHLLEIRNRYYFSEDRRNLQQVRGTDIDIVIAYYNTIETVILDTVRQLTRHSHTSTGPSLV